MSNLCLENGFFFCKCRKKSKFFTNLPGKITFLWNCLNKSKFLGNLPGKSKFFWPGSTTLQISNQNDAAVLIAIILIVLLYTYDVIFFVLFLILFFVQFLVLIICPVPRPSFAKYTIIFSSFVLPLTRRFLQASTWALGLCMFFSSIQVLLKKELFWWYDVLFCDNIRSIRTWANQIKRYKFLSQSD